MGPLSGVRLIEMAGLGPTPMAAMLLADLGATILRVERPSPSGLGIERPTRFNFTLRGRRAAAVDLKHPDGVATVLRLLDGADGLIEGFRPGTMEKLGLGPDVALARNPRLVYGRITGWGQDGPLAQAAGHDLNYIALTGALDAIGRRDGLPAPPLNLVGDYGGGALYLVVGMLAAWLERQRSGEGQVVDAAIVDGTASLMTAIYGLAAAGLHRGSRGENLLDSGSAIYDVYPCADGKLVSVAPIEPKFRRLLLAALGLAPDLPDGPGLREAVAARFLTRQRHEWDEILRGTDSCYAPVLSIAEAPADPHLAARGTFVEIDGTAQPRPAPRFSRTEPAIPTPAEDGSETRSALAEWGIPETELDRLEALGAIGLKPGSAR